MNEGKGPYEDTTVTKEECINHIQKRMGTRLRKLKDELKEEKTTKSGKIIKRSLVGGKHQLTDKQIDAYQRYFGKAIRDSVGTNILNMKLKIMSGFWHSISRDGGMEITTTTIATHHGASSKKPENQPMSSHNSISITVHYTALSTAPLLNFLKKHHWSQFLLHIHYCHLSSFLIHPPTTTHCNAKFTQTASALVIGCLDATNKLFIQ